MARTIGEAREDLLDLLDDEDNRRFKGATAAPYSKIDRALRVSLDTCLDRYVKDGGDRFDEDLDVTSDAGLVDLLTEDVRAIRSVLAIPSSGTYVQIGEGDQLTRGVDDEEDRDLRLVIVRQHAIAENPDDGDLLVGTVGGVARSWDTFDSWVIAVAADRIGSKDNETRAAIQRELARCEAAVLGHRRALPVKPWGASSRAPAFGLGRLRWFFQPRTQAMRLYLAPAGA